MCTKSQLKIILSEVATTAKITLGDKFDSAILYGSYARGDYDKDSDIDIMILADLPRDQLYTYKPGFTHLTSELGLKYDIVVTVTLKDTETFNKYLNVVPFYQSVKKEGVPIAV